MLTAMPYSQHLSPALTTLLLLVAGGAGWAEDATHASAAPAATLSEFDAGVLCGCFIQGALHASVNALTLVRHPEIGEDVRVTMWHQVDSDVLTIAAQWDLVKPWLARLNGNYRTTFVGSIDHINACRMKCGVVDTSPEYESRIQALFILVHRFGDSATAAAAAP